MGNHSAQNWLLFGVISCIMLAASGDIHAKNQEVFSSGLEDGYYLTKGTGQDSPLIQNGPGFGHHPPGVGHHGHHPPGIGHHSWDRTRLGQAYRALTAWKLAITKDPQHILSTWVGRDVCSYTGVFCSSALDNPSTQVVSGIDLNHAQLAGQIPEELGLLTDLGILHLNSNQFTGSLPSSLKNLKLLAELDVSNNRLEGEFPLVALQLPNLIYLDIRFNQFYGTLPAELFIKPLDALFLNNNKFVDPIPETLGHSTVSVIVLANNRFTGSIPSSIGNMSLTLNELIFLHNSLFGPLPEEIGLLENLNVFDVSYNRLSSPLPETISNMKALEEFNVAHNFLYGIITADVCNLPKLKNLTYSDNFFTGESPVCSNLTSKGVVVSSGGNCFLNETGQKSRKQCANFHAPPASSPVFPPPIPPPELPPALQPSAPPPIYESPESSPSPSPQSLADECPEGYTLGRNSRHCFMLVQQRRSWKDAEQHCIHHKGHLASVQSLDELKDLADLCDKISTPMGQACFLGGRRSTYTNSWNWMGSPCIAFNENLWSFLEPNNLFGNRDCTTIKYEPPSLKASWSSPSIMLNGIYCTQELPSICSPARCVL